MIKDALYAVTHGQDLSYDLAKDTMNKIMSGDVAEVPMAGFLCALAAKGPTVDEVTAFAEVMREKAGSVPHEGTVCLLYTSSLIDALYGGSYSRAITFFESKYISEIRPDSIESVNSWLLQ